MSDLFDYLRWRGDIPFPVIPPNPVDALIFSALSYIDFSGIVASDVSDPIPLADAAAAFEADPKADEKVRVRNDRKLLAAAARTERFRSCRLLQYRDIFIPEEQIQFAAVTFLLSDGSAFVAFRGTDTSVIGWKEDFNMSFQDSVPAQRQAVAYVEEFAAAVPVVLHLGGHSKGGNLAVYAAAKAENSVQDRILQVFNNDGPGFREAMLQDPGYLRMVPKIRTYIPASSIIGMLLEHEEPYTVIKSNLPSVLQHEPYSWEILGGDFVHIEEISESNQLLNRTIKNWIADMDTQARSDFVETMFDLLGGGGEDQLKDLLQPKNLRNLMTKLVNDDKTRKLLAGELVEFVRSAQEARDQLR